MHNLLKEIEVVSMLGPCFGSLGVVLLAHKETKLLALKKLDLDKAGATDLAALQKELFYTKQLRHLNLLPIERCFVDRQSLYLITPAAGYGSCADLISNHFPCGLNESALSLILRDVLQALVYLHSRRYLHRAIRGRHVLITNSGRALITCLRYAVVATPGTPTHIFTEADADNLNWLSPEVLAQDADGYDNKSDIYSVGMTCLELVNGVAPYSDVSATYMLVQKLGGWIPSFTRDVSSAMSQVLEACSRLDPEQRPTAQQLLTLPFFKTKGDLPSFLHPVIPMAYHQLQADSDDLRAIMATSNKMEDFSMKHSDWNFD